MNLDERLMAYFEGQMSKEEEDKLKSDVAIDPVLKEQFQNYYLMHEVKDELFIQNWRKKVDEWPVEQAIERTMNFKKLLWAAAVILPIIGMSLFLSSKYSSDSLIDIYSEVHDFELVARGGPIDTSALKLIAFNKAGKYEKAIALSQSCVTDLCFLHQSIAYRHTSQFNESLDVLTHLSKKDGLIKDRVDWEMLLNYLGLDNQAKAIEQAKTISSNKRSPYNSKAQTILERLD